LNNETLQLPDGVVLTLRKAEPQDVPSIVDLLSDDPLGSIREGAEADGGYGPYERAFADVAKDPNQLLVVATDDQVVVSTLQLSVIPGLSRRGARRAQIEAVQVARDYRGRGLGLAMIQWAIREAAVRQCALIQLTSDKTRVHAHRFYERLGFKATHEGFKMIISGVGTVH
jgi:ribosomal protein S18 acetylase RimI-like enzyme